MVYTKDLKSFARKGLRVRVSPRALRQAQPKPKEKDLLEEIFSELAFGLGSLETPRTN